MRVNRVLCGDCLIELKKFPSNFFDSVITDPPYGLEFMGKEWDSPQKMAGQIAKGKEQRGAFAYGGSHTRGYAAVDLNLYQEFTYQWAKQALRVAKSGATLLCFGGTRTYHRLACAIEDAGWIIKDCIMWLYGSGFPKATDISKQLDKKAEAKRKIVGENPNYRPKSHSKNKIMPRFQKDWKITEPATPEAKLWHGWKSHGLKPAYEPILMAMKPNEGSYSNNALKWGVSGLNINEARIPCKNKTKFPVGYYGLTNFRPIKRTGDTNPEGRFPANIILDEEAARLLDEQSGNVGGDKRKSKSTYNSGMFKSPAIESNALYNDKGGASRFFYVAKASRTERNIGCERLENKPAGMTMRDDKFTRENMGNTPAVDRRPVKNNHPTVKPLKLMEYLCLLTKTPTGGVVLDPFAGSGTTGMACKKTGRDYVLIEKEKEYCEIAKQRIKATPKSLL